MACISISAKRDTEHRCHDGGELGESRQLHLEGNCLCVINVVSGILEADKWLRGRDRMTGELWEGLPQGWEGERGWSVGRGVSCGGWVTG